MERIEILKNSLQKKEAKFSAKLKNHFDDVKSANGQPLNDKRNGQATMNRWDKQTNSLKNIEKEIEITKNAIENEEFKIINTADALEKLPKIILEKIKTGELVQWRKYPHILFVQGVEKARIKYDINKNIISHSYATSIKDKNKYVLFANIFNEIKEDISKGNNLI